MTKKITKLTLLAFILISSIFTFAACNDDDKDYYYRLVTSHDVIVEQTSTGLYTMNFVVRPQDTIEDLLIYFAFFDSNQSPVIANSKHLGNVNKGGEYTIQFSFSDDLTLSEMASISKYKIYFSRGTIKENQNKKGTCFNHSFGEGVVTRDAICTFKGEKLFTCKNCGYKKTETFWDDEGDNFVLWKVIEKPTSTKLGKAYYICTKCAVREERRISST